MLCIDNRVFGYRFSSIMLRAAMLTAVIGVCGLCDATIAQEQATEQADGKPAAQSQEDTEWTAKKLISAAQQDDLDSVKAAIAAGVDVDSPSAYGASALFFAADHDNREMVKFLIEKGADPNVSDTFYGATPVGWARMKQHKEVLVMLIGGGGKGADNIMLGALKSGDIDHAQAIIETKVIGEAALIRAKSIVAKKSDDEDYAGIKMLLDSMDLPDEIKMEKLSPAELKRYVGAYKGGPMAIRIGTDDEDLLIGFNNAEPNSPLAVTGPHEFSLGFTNITFEMDGDRVKQVVVDLSGNAMTLKPTIDPAVAARVEALKLAIDPPVAADAVEAVVETKPKTRTKSESDSLAMDLAISSPNWPSFRGNGGRGVAEGQNPPLVWSFTPEEEPKENPEASSEEAKEDADDGDAPAKAETTDAEPTEEKVSDAGADTDGEAQDEEEDEVEEESVAKAAPDVNIKWNTPVPGLGLSCPTIWGDKVFVTSAVAEQADDDFRTGLYGDVDSVEEDFEFDFNVYCYNKNDGQLIWEKTATTAKPQVKRHSKSSHANPTVATNGEFVVASFASEGLYCYTIDGELAWKKDLGFLDSGWFFDASYQWGFASSPVIHEDHVILQCDIQGQSFVAAYKLETGDEVWKTDREEIPGWSTPTVHKFDDVPMLITHGTKAARGYDARDGKLLWTLAEHSEIVVPTPIVAHNLIYIASGYSPIQPIYAIRPEARGDITPEGDSTTNASIEWGYKRGGPYMPSPIVYGDYFYCCANAGILTCQNAKTGERLYKKRLPESGLSFSASPIAADGHIYLPAEDGRVIVVKAGPEFEVVGSNSVGESILATPAISDGVLFIRTNKRLIAIENSEMK